MKYTLASAGMPRQAEQILREILANTLKGFYVFAQ